MPGAALTLPGTIFIVRHGEKPPDAPDGDDTTADPGPPFGIDTLGNPNKHSLTPRGWQRSGCLGQLFAPVVDPLRPGLSRPSRLLCPDYGANTTVHRAYQTLQAVSARSDVGIEYPCPLHAEPGLAAAIVGGGYTGTVLICWEHTAIPALARALPLTPATTIPPWPQGRFDVVWSFALPTDPDAPAQYDFRQLAQLVLDGDLDDDALAALDAS